MIEWLTQPIEVPLYLVVVTFSVTMGREQNDLAGDRPAKGCANG